MRLKEVITRIGKELLRGRGESDAGAPKDLKDPQARQLWEDIGLSQRVNFLLAANPEIETNSSVWELAFLRNYLAEKILAEYGKYNHLDLSWTGEKIKQFLEDQRQNLMMGAAEEYYQNSDWQRLEIWRWQLELKAKAGEIVQRAQAR